MYLFPGAEPEGHHHVRIFEFHTIYDTRRVQLLLVDTLFSRYSIISFVILSVLPRTCLLYLHIFMITRLK